MRTLNKNKVQLWLVEPDKDVETVDVDGNYTGEVTKTYSNPRSINIPLIPASGDVLTESFGESANLDYISNSTKPIKKDSLIFRSRPTTNFPETYDFTVSKVLKSLNHYVYGLTERP